MAGSDSDSESECFESAEESLDEEEKLERKTRSKKNSRESESEVVEPVVSKSDKMDEALLVEDVSINSLSYRKRPERVKRTPSIPSSKVIPKSKKPSETVFKTDVADVFFQDITSNLSKNINKSLHTLQQTSSNVKDLILSSLPASSTCEEGFVYDDGSNTLSAPVDNNILSNKIFDDAMVFSNDHLNEPTKSISMKNDEIGDVTNTQNNNSTSILLQKESSEINLEDDVLDHSTSHNSGSGTSHLNNPDTDQKSMGSNVLESDLLTEHIYHNKLETVSNEEPESLENSDKNCSPDQVLKALNDKIFDTQENQVNPSQWPIDTSAENDLNIVEPLLDDTNSNDNADSNLPGKTVPPSIVSKNDNSLQIQYQDDSFIKPECSSNLISKEVKLNVDCKNIIFEEEKNIKDRELKRKFDKIKGTISKTDESQIDNKIDFVDENDLKINMVEMKTDEEIITKQKELKGKDKTIEDGAAEINFNVKETNDKNKNNIDGWDDFDFSDNEIEDINSEDTNKCASVSKSKIPEENLINKQSLTQKSDSVKNETEMKFEAQKISEAVSLKKDLVNEDVVDENRKRKLKLSQTKEKQPVEKEFGKVLEKKVPFEVQETKQDIKGWDWENWEDETEDAEEKGESVHKLTVKNDKVENISDDGSKWSGWETFSQRMEEKQGNWNIKTWGVNLLLNKATAVTQGISSALEAGLGAPDPETFARMQKEEERQLKQDMEKIKPNEPLEEIPKKNSLTGVNLFPVSGITNLVAGVTNKIVEHTKIQEIGSKVLTGGLDTLETFGKKTMEVLQDGDPGLRNKRALLLGNNKPVLSQILREAREKADKEIKQAEEKALAKKCHFETLFDDFQGMVHLEALEMLSRQHELKLEQAKCGMNSEELEDLEGVLEEVEELCALDDSDINLSVLDFKTSLQMAVEALKDEICIEKIIQVHDNVNKWLQTSSELDPSPTTLHQKAVSTVAELTAATVHEFHKAGELLSIKEFRRTLDEIVGLARLTNILCLEIDKICGKFILMSQIKSKKDVDSTNTIIEKVTIMRNNSTSYIKQAFNLLIPVLQAGAAL